MLYIVSKIKNIFSVISNNFCDAEQVSILRYFKGRSPTEYVFILYNNICLSKFNC